MSRLIICLLSLSVCVAVAQAEMILYEDFESYPVDETIHFKGIEQNPYWGEIPRWYAQDNTSQLQDNQRMFVREFGGNKYLEAGTMDTAGNLDTFALAMAMESHAIVDQGTVYMRIAFNDYFAPTISTNSLEPGWAYDDPLGEIGTAGYQGDVAGDGYRWMGAMAQPGWTPATPPLARFRGRNGAYGYEDDLSITNTPLQEWVELWIQVDCPNKRAKFYICPEGGTPQKAMNPTTGEWWAWRNEGFDNEAVWNIKFIISNWGWTDTIENVLLIDTIGIDQTTMTTDRVGPATLPNPFDPAPFKLPGDANLDCTVDLDDFVILKTNFGTGTTWGEGDFDEDGDVDLDDFVILKTNFGTSCPE